MAGCKKTRGLNSPKVKRKSAFKKRFSLSGSGKVVFKKKGLKHNLSNKNRKQKRNLKKSGIMKKVDAQIVMRGLIA